jgi:hypothetical protein
MAEQTEKERAQEPEEADQELSVEALDQIVGGGRVYNKTFQSP